MPRKTKELRAEYARERRKRKKQRETELDTQIAHVKQMQEIAALDEVKERQQLFRLRRQPKARPRWLRREVNRRKRLPENMMCSCGRGPLKSRQFVIDNGVAVCLICYRGKQ